MLMESEMENGIEKQMYDEARSFLVRRYPRGWGGAAVLRTETGRMLLSVAVETANAAASLCIETGAICEAHKIQERVTHSLCLVRENSDAELKILTPCGICQERLMYWGNVRVAVTHNGDTLRFVPLAELQPHHWSGAYRADELESFENEQA